MRQEFVCTCGEHMTPMPERDAYRCRRGHVIAGVTLVEMSREAFDSIVRWVPSDYDNPRPVTREMLDNAMLAQVGIEQGMASASRVNAADDEINAEIDAFYELINGQKAKAAKRKAEQ